MEAAAIASLKRQRTTAKRNFTRKTNSLNTLIELDADGIPQTPVAEVDLCFDELNNSWKTVQQKHDAYVDAATTDDTTEEDDQEKEWIQGLEDSFAKSRKSVVSYRENVKKQYNCSSAKRSYTLQEQNYLDTCKSLESLLSSSSPLPETLTNERLATSSQLDKLREVYNIYALVLTEDEMNKLSKKLAIHVKSYSTLKVKVDHAIAEYKQQALAKKTPFRMKKCLYPILTEDGENILSSKRISSTSCYHLSV